MNGPRIAFNGFDRARMVEVGDGPLLRTPGYDQAVERLAA
jgi:hypothetical protein